MQYRLAFESSVKRRCSGRLTCRGGLIKCYPMFYSSHEIWKQYGSKNVHINLLSKPEFRENIQSDSCAFLKVSNEFLSYFPQFSLILVKLGANVRCVEYLLVTFISGNDW